MKPPAATDSPAPPTGRAVDGSWTWRGHELIDQDGLVVATVCADVVCIDDERLLCESLRGRFGLRCRATSGGGEVFTVTQRWPLMSRLIANCSGRRYTLARGLFRGNRTLTGPTGVVAVTTGRADGSVDITPGPAADDVAKTDFVYLTWVCFLADGAAPGVDL